jgi:hypothetical protein
MLETCLFVERPVEVSRDNEFCWELMIHNIVHASPLISLHMLKVPRVPTSRAETSISSAFFEILKFLR